jgi:hypothetical protein
MIIEYCRHSRESTRLRGYASEGSAYDMPFAHQLQARYLDLQREAW